MKNFNLGKTLGEGSFGKVRLATHLQTQQKVAIKIINKKRMASKEMNEKVQEEISILKKINHPHIIQLYQIFQDEENIFLVMEFAERGDLLDFIKQDNTFTQIQASIVLLDIIEALTHLHEHCIAHRDIKLANILLTADENGKLIDFGLSKKYEKNKKLRTGCGSPCFAAPEVIKEEAYDAEKADVWSVGVVMYCLVEGKLPFYHHSIKELYKLIEKCRYEKEKTKNERLKKLFKEIFVADANARLSLKKVWNHESLMVAKIIRRKQREKKEQNSLEKEETIKNILMRKMAITSAEMISLRQQKQYDSLNTTICLMKKMQLPHLYHLLEKQAKFLLRTTSMRSSISSTASNFKSEGSDFKRFIRKSKKLHPNLKSTKSAKNLLYDENIKYIHKKDLLKYSESLERGKLEEILNRNNLPSFKHPDVMMTRSVNVEVEKTKEHNNLAFYREGIELPTNKKSGSFSKVIRKTFEDLLYLLQKWGGSCRIENYVKVWWKRREYRILVDRVSMNLQMIRCEPFCLELVSQVLKFLAEQL